MANKKFIFIVLALIVVVGVAVILVIRNKPKPSQATTNSTASVWHVVTPAGQGLRVTTSCQNVVTTPKQNVDGLLGSVSNTAGYSAVHCQTANNGCELTADDAVLPKSTAGQDVTTLLRTLSYDKTNPVTTYHGAAVIKSSMDMNSDGSTKMLELNAIANGRYYRLQASCPAGSTQAGWKYLNSFTPITQ